MYHHTVILFQQDVGGKPRFYQYKLRNNLIKPMATMLFSDNGQI